jgi:signal transduction histidine kinase
MRLSQFISTQTEEILAQWDAFALTQQPAAAGMSTEQLRNHARQLLQAIAADLETEQTAQQQRDKSMGAYMAIVPGASDSAASTHGGQREAHGFTLQQLTAEYRAIRASVLRLWQAAHAPTASSLEDVIRFNEAIDQALAESVVQYAEQAKRTREVFLAVLGHDLRAPLSAIAQASQSLTDPNPREVGRTGARIRRNAAAMRVLADDLLEYAHTQLGGKLHVSPQEQVDLRAVAEASLHDASAVHPDCPYELDAQGDLVGRFDGRRVRQLLVNLLSSAAQYRDRQYRVSLELRGEAGAVVILVRNRGSLIPASHLEAVFNPQVDIAVEPEEAGPAASLSLGLFVARELTRAHDGSIAATSDGKHGTVFSVRLPRHAQEALHDGVPAGR